MAASTVPAAQQLAWYQNPEFAAARVRVVPPGGRTTYGESVLPFFRPQISVDPNFEAVEPRPVGATPTDVTSFQYG